MTSSKSRRLGVAGVVVVIALVGPTASLAGPNLMAIGNYGDVPYKRAAGRDSLPGKEVIFDFENPDFDFGRVIVRARQPNSVVRRDLFVGFSGDGLIVDTRTEGSTGGAVNIDELEIWLRIQGEIRPKRNYEWELEAEAGDQNLLDQGFPATIPAVWADGEPVGADVTVRMPQVEGDDAIRRLLLPHGVVQVKDFSRQTGGAWVVLRPARFGAFFEVRRFSFREAETREELTAKADMPIPVRYVPIRDVLEDNVAEALQRGTETLRAAQNPEQVWAGSSPEESVGLTALVVAAIGEAGSERQALMPAMEWLARQQPAEGQAWANDTVALRLYCLARFGGLEKFRQIIHTDIQTLAVAQSENGGWASGARGERSSEAAIGRADNPTSALVVRALREARFAGATIDAQVWRRALQYWTDAQAYDGGFRETLERFGGLGKATTSTYTSLGAAAMMASLDVASGMDGRRCNTYLASRRQLRGMNDAIGWLDAHYRELLSEVTGFVFVLDPYAEPYGLQWLGEVSGMTHFNGKDHFAESARSLLSHYDEQRGMFGVRREDKTWGESPSIRRTARAMTVLGAGSAPTVCQRIIVGEDAEAWTQYNGDVAHLVRFLSAERRRPLNWRRARIEYDVRELVEVPIMLLSIVGPMEWSQEQWSKIREYCFAGGTVVIDMTEGQESQRADIVAALRQTFPEYELTDLPSDSPIFSAESPLAKPPKVKVLGNGFRQFLLIPEESWSCHWQLYQVGDRRDSFMLMNNLLAYATEGTALRGSFAPSTYAVRSSPSHTMSAAHVEVGGRVPAYPNLIDTMDGLMQTNFRLEVATTSDAASADLVWLSVTGSSLETETVKSVILSAARHGRFVLADVVSGRREWDGRSAQR